MDGVRRAPRRRWRSFVSTVGILILCCFAALQSCHALLPPRQASSSPTARLHQSSSSAAPGALDLREVEGSGSNGNSGSPPSPFTRSLQIFHLSLAAGAVVAPEAMDSATSRLWTAFNDAPLTHHPMFEASLAVFCFLIFISLFESLHLYLPTPERFRIDGKVPVRALENFTMGKIHKSLVPPIAYLGSIALFQALGLNVLLFGPKLPVSEAPTYVRLISEVSIGVFLYDLLFYPIHLSFHRAESTGWKKLHARHHRWAWEEGESAAHNAVETVQNSYVDAAIQVMINICVQYYSPWGFKHPLSRALHNIMVVYLLTESHSGYELDFMSHKLFPGVFAGPVAHERHHTTGRSHYHQFFTYLDRIFGFTEEKGRF